MILALTEAPHVGTNVVLPSGRRAVVTEIHDDILDLKVWGGDIAMTSYVLEVPPYL
jgi:hypothetical protein